MPNSTPLPLTYPERGVSVTLEDDADRFPNALIRAGITGTVDTVDRDARSIWIALNEEVEGLASWGNQLCFSPEAMGLEDGDEAAFLAAFWRAVRISA